MGFLTAEPLNASWIPEEESSQTNTQRRQRRWNVVLSTNFSRALNSSAAKISKVFLASRLVFSAAVSNAPLRRTLTLRNMYFILCIHLFLLLYASENLGFETKDIRDTKLLLCILLKLTPGANNGSRETSYVLLTGPKGTSVFFTELNLPGAPTPCV